MKNEDCTKFPLVRKYLVDLPQVQEQIKGFFGTDTIFFCQSWEPILEQVSSCAGFESKIAKIRENPKELFHILNEFMEAAFLRSKGFSINFPTKGPDFIAKLGNDVYCYEVKTIEAVTEGEIYEKLNQLNLPISISFFYDPIAYFDKQMLCKLMSKVQKTYQKKCYLSTEKANRKSIRTVFADPVSVKLNFKGMKAVGGVISPSNPEKDYSNTWCSIHDHLSDALKNLAACKESGHKIVVLNTRRPEIVFNLKDVLYGKTCLILDEAKAYRSDAIFELPEFSEIQAVVVYSDLKVCSRLVFPNSYYHDLNGLDPNFRERQTCNQ